MYQQQYQQQQYQQPAGQAPAASNGSALMVQGRLVWVGGSLFTGKKKVDDQNRPVMDQETGQQVIEYGFGLAIPKIDPRTGQATEIYSKVWNALHAEAYTLYPSGQLPPDFAMKYKDGDGLDHNNKPFSQREGYAGHFILNCTTQIQPKFFIWQNGNNVLVNDGIKCGDYVNVQLNIKAHPAKGRGKAGLYLNPSAIQLIQPGKEIINTPSGDQLFGQTAPVYAGQAVADPGPTMPNMGAPAPMPNQGMMPQGAPQQHYAQPPQQGYQQPAPAPQADPHYGILPATHQPMQPAPAPQQYQQPAPAPQQAGGMPPLPGMPR